MLDVDATSIRIVAQYSLHVMIIKLGNNAPQVGLATRLGAGKQLPRLNLKRRSNRFECILSIRGFTAL